MPPEPISTATEAAKEGVGLLRSLVSVAGNVRTHNDRLRDLHEDVSRWVRDQLRLQSKALDEVRANARERNLGSQGLGAQGEAAVRRDFAHQWRDRRSEYERALRDLKNSENSVHRAYRKLRRKQWPENAEAEQLGQLTREWDELNP